MKTYPLTFLELLKKQDADAFGQIYNEYIDIFYRYMKWHYFLDEGDIHDLLWDIFVKIWNALPRLDIESSLSWFLWTIAKNHTKDFFKRNTETPFASFNTANTEWDEQQWEHLLEDDNNFLEMFNTQYTYDVIHTALCSIDDIYKDPIMLKFIEECSYEEIAKTLHISQDTVRKRISRWLKKLAELINHIQ